MDSMGGFSDLVSPFSGLFSGDSGPDDRNLGALLGGQQGPNPLAAPLDAQLDNGTGFHNGLYYMDGKQRVRPNPDGTRTGQWNPDQMRDYMDMSSKMSPEWAEEYKQQSAQRGKFPTLRPREAANPADIAAELRKGAARRLYENNEFPTFKPSRQNQDRNPSWWPANPPEDPTKQSWRTMPPTFPNRNPNITEPTPQRGLKQWQQLGLDGPRPGTPDWIKQQQEQGQPNRNIGTLPPGFSAGGGVPQPPQQPPAMPPQQSAPPTPTGAALRQPPGARLPAAKPANAWPGQQAVTLGGGGAPVWSQYNKPRNI